MWNIPSSQLAHSSFPLSLFVVLSPFSSSAGLVRVNAHDFRHVLFAYVYALTYENPSDFRLCSERASESESGGDYVLAAVASQAQRKMSQKRMSRTNLVNEAAPEAESAVGDHHGHANGPALVSFESVRLWRSESYLVTINEDVQASAQDCDCNSFFRSVHCLAPRQLSINNNAHHTAC